ncbi:hypothetical protein [Ruegeria sp. HKCCA5014]|uniref:phage head spike fiber domain-containing protein n=1 Tax=Ruegeria sp. HKCCA5014 TaxID=2682980 RepID=UPI001C2BF494|nr:hypothetical protein [Ruegeria sp. HKCCA5014]
MVTGSRFQSGRFAFSGRTAPLRDPFAAYGVNGMVPDVVADFSSSAYRGTGGPVSFHDAFDFARGSTATYVNSSGLLSQAVPGEPRFDHRLTGGTWQSAGLLLESEARTNLLLHASGFDAPVWSRSRASVTPNDALAPDGTGTASRLTSTADTFDGAVQQSVAYLDGDVLTFSVYAKAGDREFIFLRERTHGFAKDSYFNLSAGVTGTVNSVHTAAMEALGNGWYRCAITVQATRSAISAFEIYNSEEDLNTSSAQPGFTYIWGAQLEHGGAPSSFIPTQASAQTRAAESITLKSASLPDSGVSQAVSIALEGALDRAAVPGRAVLLDWSDGLTEGLEYDVAADGRKEVLHLAGGTGTTVSSAPGSVGFSHHEPFVFASRHTSSEVALADGSSAAVSGIPVLGSQDLILGPGMMGHVERLRLWASDIGNMGLQTL